MARVKFPDSSRFLSRISLWYVQASLAPGPLYKLEVCSTFERLNQAGAGAGPMDLWCGPDRCIPGLCELLAPGHEWLKEVCAGPPKHDVQHIG